MSNRFWLILRTTSVFLYWIDAQALVTVKFNSTTHNLLKIDSNKLNTCSDVYAKICFANADVWEHKQEMIIKNPKFDTVHRQQEWQWQPKLRQTEPLAGLSYGILTLS